MLGGHGYIISDLANLFCSSSYSQGEMVGWVRLEFVATHRGTAPDFGIFRLFLTPKWTSTRLSAGTCLFTKTQTSQFRESTEGGTPSES